MFSSQAFVVLLALALSREAIGQCGALDPNFGRGTSALDDSVDALLQWDDGTGPALYAGGMFTHAGLTAANHIAKWNGTSWEPLGQGLTGATSFFPTPHVTALAVFDDGSGLALYASGEFTTAGGVPAHGIAKWNGSSWSSLPGSDAVIPSCMTAWSLCAMQTGGGHILCVGIQGYCTGPSASRVLAWDGTNWWSLGELIGAHVSVDAMSVVDDGSGPALYVGGIFTAIDSVAAHNIAKWNGTNWSALGTGMTEEFGYVGALAAYDDGAGTAIYAGGAFTIAGHASASYIAKWIGGSWSPVGGGMDGTVSSLLVFDDGSGPSLYAGGAFTHAGGNPAAYVARWNGAGWSALDGHLDGSVSALASFDDGTDASADLYAGGSFAASGVQPLGHVAEWHGCSTTGFCYGDGSVIACPCANNGTTGHGCDNSAATGGALLAASGTLVPDTLKLTQTGELASSLSIFLQGDAAIAPTFFGDGLRCAGGTLKRLYVKTASSGTVVAPAAGDPSITARSAALGDPIAPGSTRYYQVYYRDPILTFCPNPPGDSFNVGSALRVVW
jgi:hypothetical protein